MPGLRVTLTNRQQTLKLDRRKVLAAARRALSAGDFRRGSVSLAVVDDPTIHALNRRFLRHDYPTDVLSFVLEQAPGYLEGEVIVSADTARQRAAEFGCTPHEELLLYLVHGILHLVGFGDHTVRERRAMRAKEAECLGRDKGTEKRRKGTKAQRHKGKQKCPRTTRL